MKSIVDRATPGVYDRKRTSLRVKESTSVLFAVNARTHSICQPNPSYYIRRYLFWRRKRGFLAAISSSALPSHSVLGRSAKNSRRTTLRELHAPGGGRAHTPNRCSLPLAESCLRVTSRLQNRPTVAGSQGTAGVPASKATVAPIRESFS